MTTSLTLKPRVYIVERQMGHSPNWRIAIPVEDELLVQDSVLGFTVTQTDARIIAEALNRLPPDVENAIRAEEEAKERG